jgi:Leu/Phe-tRNA-protein transferase
MIITLVKYFNAKFFSNRYFKENYDANKMAVMHDIAFFQDTTPYLTKTCQKNSHKKVFNCSGIDIVSLARTVSTGLTRTFLFLDPHVT